MCAHGPTREENVVNVIKIVHDKKEYRRELHTFTRHIELLTLKVLTTFKEIVNRSNLEDTLHIFVQDTNFRLSIGVDDKFC